jgi:large subunit ribosomal protein L29
MRAEEIRELDLEELAAKENEMREQLFRLRFQLGMGQTDGIKKYRALRKDLARLLTVRQEKSAAAEQGS